MVPTSEQELKTLLDEGKITQEEYGELLAAMKDKPRPNGVSAVPAAPEEKSKTKLGKTALLIFILSFVLSLVPVVLCIVSYFIKSHIVWGKIVVISLINIPLGILCGLVAFVLGLVAWKTTSGKIAALGVPLITGCEILFLLIALPIFSYKTSAVQLAPVQVYKTYSCDSLDSLIVGTTGSPAEKGIFSEDNGAIKIQVLGADTFHLYETGPLENANNTMLFYQAKVRTEALSGKGYLELWCSIPGKGEFFSRGLDQPIYGTNNWTTMQIPFRNDMGINPDNIKLNLVILGQGTGTIWIDDIQVTGNPL